mgnify:CR=1 FL=1|tara:strand:- start:5 stop:724 length:720 start_codon:yes stop_codon:yes gene_type:complete
MGYFRELPNIYYQSPLSNKISSSDLILVKNIFRRVKFFNYLSDNATLFNKYVINDGDRPDTIAESLYGSSRYDFVVVLVAGITNITQQWPVQDYQIYDIALEKYGTETLMNETHHYETFEIKDSMGHQILPPNLIVDVDFKIDGSSLRYPTNRFTLISEAGNNQLDDKNEYTVATDNIARPVTNYEYEINENEKLRKIDTLRKEYLQVFLNDLRDVVSYDKNSRYITRSLAQADVNLVV